MMNDPEILILDEPTSGLDPNQIVEIREIIRQIGKEKTVILSTHILSEAEATCNRIVIINKGKIIADGSTQILKQSAGEQRTIHLSLLKADSSVVRDRLNRVAGVSDVDTEEDRTEQVLHAKLTCTADTDLRESIYHTIKATDWVLLEFYQESQTLENIFRELTREN
jgi:ABC-2 type transport system ATP-binding protein